MIKRIVLMEIEPGREALFLDIFEGVKNQIRSCEGCMGLELLQSENEGKTILWTISIWQSEADLESYRTSDLFQKTWSAVKPLFSGKARAWTLNPIETLA
ncbi:MAG: antibiotic biosynthesis monooxygenase family protein [Saprospiraceae bacterium]